MCLYLSLLVYHRKALEGVACFPLKRPGGYVGFRFELKC